MSARPEDHADHGREDGDDHSERHQPAQRVGPHRVRDAVIVGRLVVHPREQHDELQRQQMQNV